MNKKTKNISEKSIFICGLVIVLLSLLPYLILGENSIVSYHDQLDGEVLAYIFHAKYLLSGTLTYPEIMNGIPTTGLTPPAMFAILYYKFLPPFAAFVVNMYVCILIGYVGMYFCAKTITGNAWISVFTAVLFVYLPIFSVYGLAQYGVPLLVVSCICLWKKEKKAASLVYIFWFGLYSSLVLVGYAILGFGVLGLVYFCIKKKMKQHMELLWAWIILLGSYLLTNMSLLTQIFGIGEQIESHKEDLVRYGRPFLTGFKETFYEGSLHTPSHQQVIVWISTLLLLCMFICWKYISNEEKKYTIALASMYGFQLFCCAFYGFVHTCFVAELRNRIGGIVNEFQMDRIFWLTVSVWYMMLAVILKILWIRIQILWNGKRKLLTIGYALFLCVTVLGTSMMVFYYSDFNKNLHRLRGGENYQRATWSDFYASDVFDQIKECIGEAPESYRVLSLGIHPAAAIYNGFYSLDAYSNNYAKEYKQEFRSIIAGELEKDDALRLYYDEWGCRCYLLSTELGNADFFIQKGSGKSVKSLSIDTQAAKNMGAKYIFSAVPIENAKELSMELIQDESFATDTSWVEIYVYKLL